METYARGKGGELAKDILKGLVIGGLIIVALGASPNIPQILKLFKTKNSTDRYRIRRAINGLVRNKLVTVSYAGGKEIIKITEDGKTKVLEYNLDNLKIRKPKNWDRHWRLVMFDIPNRMKKVRESINWKLKDMGFIPYQKSVFISPYKARDEIEFLSEHYLVKKHIKYIVAKKIDDEDVFIKRFSLS